MNRRGCAPRYYTLYFQSPEELVSRTTEEKINLDTVSTDDILRNSNGSLSKSATGGDYLVTPNGDLLMPGGQVVFADGNMGYLSSVTQDQMENLGLRFKSSQ